MKHVSRILILGVLLAVVSSLLIAPVMAQEEGEGGVISFSTFGAGPDTFNPVYCTGTDCADVVNFMHVGLFGVDPDTATLQPDRPGALARDWTVSEDNRTYTINLRDDLYFTDGTQITANDLMYMWENITTNPEAQYSLAYLADSREPVYVQSVNMIDDFTIEVTMNEAQCDVLGNISGALTGRGRVVPSHVFSQYEVADLATIPYSLNPDVTSGAFTLGEHRPAEITTLLGWDEYADAPLGYVAPDGILYLVVPDQNVQLEEFLAPTGEVNLVVSVPPNRASDVRAAAEAGTHQIYDFPGNTWDYMAFNLADPTNPQPALDEDGNRIDQGLHPIFSDVLVRQAIGHAVDVDSIIEGAVFGEGTRMNAHITPSSWAFHEDLPAREYNQQRALELLEEAGWVPGADGRLVCQGCLYAREVDPNFEGSPMEFELITNAGNTRREAIGAIIQDALDEIGITVNFQTIEFNSLLDVMDAQTYDTLILGWRAGYPDSPDTLQLFGAGADLPGSGNNFTSFYNERYFELEQAALTVSGCAEEDRRPYYLEMQEIMAEEMPYLWLFSQDGLYAARSNVQGFDPRPANLFWNVTTWTVSDQ